jgi:predicted GIY-YIG superfamily endonuclease
MWVMAFWVYILECADGSYYVGHSDNLAERLHQHQSGALGGYTKSRRPVRLAYSQDFTTRDDAFAAEQQIKGWSRQKKAALIRGDWEELRRLARGRQRASAHPSTGSG